jgi:CRP-like cAMP-binding protein
MVRKYSEIFVSRLGGPLLAETLKSGLSDPDRHRLNKITSNRQYEKGDAIFLTGNVPDEIVVLANGTAELIGGADARNVAMGELFGLTETLAEAKFCASLIALTDCEVDVIGRDDLIEYLRSTPEACFRSLAAVAENLHHAQDKAAEEV